MTHKKECHFDDNRKIIDRVKVWTDSELESSILFEVPKKKNPRNDEITSKENSNEPSTLMERISGNNNAKDDEKYNTIRNPDQAVEN